ncbi:MAG: type II secretion system F family protein [Sneathiella sp.]
MNNMSEGFKYKAIDASSGQLIEGLLEATDKEAATAQLHLQGHIPIEVKSSQNNFILESLKKDISGSRKIQIKDVSTFCREITLLLKAGLTLERSLEITNSTASSKSVKALLKKMLIGIREGRSLTEVCAENRDKLPSLMIDMLRAGEEASALATAFDRLALHYEKHNQTIEKIKSSLIYPAILLITSGLSIVFLITFVLPQFQPMFESSGKELPWLAKGLIEVGVLFSNYWWLFAFLSVGIVFITPYYLAKPHIKKKLDILLQKAPFIGKLILDLEVSRLASTLNMLVSNGTSLNKALKVTAETSKNTVTKNWAQKAEQDTKEGKSLSHSFEKEGFPSMACQLVAIGEETGKLGDMFAHIAEIYEQNTLQNTQRLLTLLSPTLTILLGGVVAVIVGSLLATVMEINEFAF